RQLWRRHVRCLPVHKGWSSARLSRTKVFSSSRSSMTSAPDRSVRAVRAARGGRGLRFPRRRALLPERDLDRRLDMKLALRRREQDAMGAAFVPNMQHDIAFHIAHAVPRVLDPDAQLQLDGAVAELLDDTDGRGIREHARRFARSLEAKRPRRAEIRLVGDANGHPEPDLAAAVGP